MRNYRLHYALFALLIFGISGSSYAQWQKVFKFPSSARTIYFLDQLGHAEKGFAGLNDGSIWMTTDYGATWEREFADPLGLSVTDITFKDSLTGWFCTTAYIGQNGTASVFRTTDGGKIWLDIGAHGGRCTALYYHAAQKLLYLSEWTKGAYQSGNDGNNWNQFTLEDPLNGYAFSDPQNGILTFAGFGGAKLYETSDGGNNWQAVSQSPMAWQPASKSGTSTFFIFSEYTATLSRLDGIGQGIRTISTIGSGTNGAFTGCVRLSECNGSLYVQSTTNQGLFMSPDEGVTWQNIGGPTNEEDSRFWINNNAVFASDYFGTLSVYHEKVADPTLSLSQDTVRVFSKNCNAIDTTIYFHIDKCSIGFDSIMLAKFSVTSPFQLPAGEIIPRRINGNDSLKIRYSPNGTHDTIRLILHYITEGKEIDSAIYLMGDSPIPFTSFAPQLSSVLSTHQTSVIAGKDTAINLSVSGDIPSSEGLDSIVFDLKFNSNMLNLDYAKTQAGWVVTLDSIQPGSYRCTFYNKTRTDITANQILASFYFSGFLGLDTISTVNLIQGNAFFDPLKHTGCAIESMASNDSIVVQAAGECGDPTLRHFLKTGLVDFSIISIRPNPAQDEIIIATQFATPNEASIIIFDDLGRQWHHEQKTFFGRNKNTVAISSLPTGNYHVMLKSASGSVASDFVKVH